MAGVIQASRALPPTASSIHVSHPARVGALAGMQGASERAEMHCPAPPDFNFYRANAVDNTDQHGHACTRTDVQGRPSERTTDPDFAFPGRGHQGFFSNESLENIARLGPDRMRAAEQERNKLRHAGNSLH
jgi:hypothetical protein